VEDEAGAKPGVKGYPRCRRVPRRLWRSSRGLQRYPSTDAGIASRYYAASAWPCSGVMRGRRALPGDGRPCGANSFYGRVARLGVIEAQYPGKKVRRGHHVAQALVNNTSDDRFRATRC
jgi:hypothetical protein